LARSQLVGAVWAVAAATTWFTAEAPLRHLFEATGIVSSRGYLDTDYFLRLLVYLPACAMIVVAMARRLSPHAREQGVFLLRLGLMGLMAAASLSVVVDDHLRDDGWLRPVAVAAGATLLAAASLWLERDAPRRWPALALLGASFAAWSAGLLAAGASGWISEAGRALLFIVYWAVVGGLAARIGQRTWFGVAFTMVGLRLLILYFEAIGGLTATGFGLIGGGALCLALATIGWRLTRGVSRRSVRALS